MARKGGETKQKPETEQGRRESIGEECDMPKRKCAAKRRRIIWGKRGTNDMENGREYRRKGGGSTLDRGGGQTGPRKDPNAMDIDRGRGGDRMCYVCGKWGYMAKNCWERYKRRVVEMLQESVKENRGQ